MKTYIVTNWNKLLGAGLALLLLSLFSSRAAAQDTFDASGYTGPNDEVWVSVTINWDYEGPMGDEDNQSTSSVVLVLVNGDVIGVCIGGVGYDNFLVPVSDRTSDMSVTTDWEDYEINDYGTAQWWYAGIQGTAITPIHNTKKMALGSSSVPFGQVRVGTSNSNALSVSSTGTLNLSVSSSFNSGAPFSSTPVASNRTIYGDSSENDNVTFAPTTRGTFTDSLIYTSDADDVSQQRMAVYVSGQGIQAVFNATNGNSIAFGNLHVGNTTQQTYSFSNTGDDTLYLQKPAISGSAFSLDSSQGSITLAPGQTASLNVKFTAALWQSYRGTLSFSASNGITTPSITLSGVGILPQIQNVSSAVAFGKVRVSKMPQGTITFSNTGNDILHISNVTLPQPFVLQGYDQSVAPGVTGTFHFVYAPNKKGFDSAQLRFTTDDPSHPSFAIAINGQGTQAIFNAYEGTTVPFGNVHVGGSAQQEFLFSNTGDDTLFLQSPTISGNAYSIISNPGNLVVLPFQGISVMLQFTPTAEQTYSGILSYTASNGIVVPPIFLSGKGALPHMLLVANNRQTVDLGQVKINSRTTHDFVIANNGGADLKITNASVSPLPFSIAAFSPSILANTIGYVTVAFAPTATGGFSGTVLIAGDDASNPSDTIFVTGTGINSNLSINPENASFGSVPVTNTIMDTITLSNTGTAMVKISSYKITPEGAFAIVSTSATQVSAGGTTIVVVSFRPDTAGNYSGMLTISTDDASAPIRTINLSGVGVKGILAVTPSIDFDTVTVGQNATFRALLKNIGQANLTISSLQMAGDAFSHSSFVTPLTLAPGDSASLDITFTPAAKGSADGSVQFSLGDNTSVSMALHGVGEVIVIAGVDKAVGRGGEFSLSVSPNPATTSVTAHINIRQAMDGEIKIFDATGREMLQIPLGLLEEGTHDFSLPIEHLASGSYYIRVISSKGNAVMTKLILQR